MTRSKIEKPLIHPVILCGGSGTRLWPVSRNSWPKQFIRLVSEKSLLQNTIELLKTARIYSKPCLVANEAFQFVIKEQLEEIKAKVGSVILEPEGRNTAAAITLSALHIAQDDPDAILLILPSDHSVENFGEFHSTIFDAYETAQEDKLTIFGMQADTPETGYGYICQGKKISSTGNDCFEVERFVEKPTLEMAGLLLEDGRYHWNSGMLMFKASVFIKAMQHFQPEILKHCKVALSQSSSEGYFLHPQADEFIKCENISIDYALLEKASNVAVKLSKFIWSDIGTWASVAALGDMDKHGNVVEGDAVLRDCQGTYIRSSGRLVAAIGVEDFIIIETDDAILVAPKSKVQDVKSVVKKLRSMGRCEADSRPKVRRPWGEFIGVHQGQNHQVKHIVVKPGEVLSYQYHHHRSEHWIIVSGEAEVTLGKEVKTLRENDSVYIPVGVAHRLHNPISTPLHLIEVQYGDYLGEDDIVRLDDIYGRVEPILVAAE